MWDQHILKQPVGLEHPGAGFDPARPPLLCLHGSGGEGAEFAPLLRELEGRANPAALDLPGHGATGGPGLTSVEDYAAWVGGFLAAGPLKPVLLGNSLGGAIALSLAITRPELLSGLVLWGTGARLRVLPSILAGLAGDPAATVDMLVDLAYAPGSGPELREAGAAMMRRCDPSVILGDYSACDRFDLMSGLPRINLPTLVVCGREDRLTPVKYSRYLAENIPGAELAVIPGAGHYIHQEQPRAGAGALTAFLGKIRNTASRGG